MTNTRSTGSIGPSFDQTIVNRANQGIGTVLFVFKIPRNPEAHEFPQPMLGPTPFEFLDWSELPDERVNPKRLNPACHLYQQKQERIMLMGVVGPMDKLYQWAQEWVNEVSALEKYKVWTGGKGMPRSSAMLWMNHEDLLKMDGDNRASPAEQQIDSSQVDIDAPGAYENIHKPTAVEAEFLKDNPNALWGAPDDDTGLEDIGIKPGDQ